MALEVLAALVIGGIIFIIFMVHVTGRWVKRDDPDTGTALIEFNRVYPGEAIRSVVHTTDSRAHFYRLHGGKTGFLQEMGHHSVARLIEAGSIHVAPTDNAKSLKIDRGGVSRRRLSLRVGGGRGGGLTLAVRHVCHGSP